MAELEDAGNAEVPVVPQVLAKDGELAGWFIGEVRKLGCTEVNLNFGCPSGTVTAKGKGAGMLRDPAKLDAFLDAVFSAVEGPVSVKTRLGVQSAEEFGAILAVYNQYPICELTIHPRVMKQLYRGEADRAAFARYLADCQMPVCYNGDITTPEALHGLEAQFPTLSGIMVGRGAHRGPGAAPPRAGRAARLQRGAARLCGRPLPRLHRRLRDAQLRRQPDEGPLVLPAPPTSRALRPSKAPSAKRGRAGSMRRW